MAEVCRIYHDLSSNFTSCHQVVAEWELSESLTTAILAGGGAGLVNNDRGQLREDRLEAVEQPFRQRFARGVGETVDFIEVVMIQAFDERFGGFFDVAVVDQIALGWIDFPLDDHIESERMPMQPPALVVRRQGRQIV